MQCVPQQSKTPAGMFRCEKCQCEWGESFGEAPNCSYRESEKQVVKHEEHTVEDNRCINGHVLENLDCVFCKETFEEDAIQPAKDYYEKYNGHV